MCIIVTRQAVQYQRNMSHLLVTIDAVQKYNSECVSVALVIHYARRIRRILLSSVACLALSYLSTLSRKRHDYCA